MATRSVHQPDAFGDFLRDLTFDFFGSGRHKISIEQLLAEPGAVLLDVRSPEEVQTLALQFSPDVTMLHIPTNDIPDRIGEIPRDKMVGVFCSSGTRSAIVYAFLRAKGHANVRVVLGGYEEIASLVLPGNLLKHIEMKKAGE